MDSLISIINELQDASSAVGESLDLPQIAVVGNQSAGKSSVLENIVGRDFLPRGTGIVTRRPLVLQLVNDSVEVAEFLHRPGQIFSDVEKIRREIQMETDRMTGPGKGISPLPINLKISSPSVPNLTLVDLPGMTKVPVEGQPEDVETQIRNMILNFIQRPNCLILTVNPANADLATSDAIKLAQEVDPDGARTIGVLTKLDLMDGGTNARQILLNNVIPLRYGYIAVVNRSQMDIEGNKNICAALEAEKRFFLDHSEYGDLEDRVGTECLRRSLSVHLTRHIAQNLPDLKILLRARLGDLERQLAGFQTEFDYEDPFWKHKAIVIFAVKFAENYKAELAGNSDSYLNLSALSFGAKIREILHKDFASLLSNTEFSQEDVMKREIGIAIQNILGVRTGLFTPDKAFDLIIQEQLLKLHPAAEAVIQAVSDELFQTVRSSLASVSCFPGLQEEMRSRAASHLHSAIQKTREAVEQLIHLQRAYINTKHEDFVGFSFAEQKAYSRVLKRRNPGAEIKCEGFLNLAFSFGRSRKFWFVLGLDSLAWFTDEAKSERVYTIPLDEGLRYRDSRRENRFCIYREGGKTNIWKDKTQLDLQAPSLKDLQYWKKSLIQVGVFCEDAKLSLLGEESSVSRGILETDDPWLERQIESLWILVDSYMRIVCKTIKDLVPKCLVRLLIRDTINFFSRNLVAELSRIPNFEELMHEDEKLIQKRQDLTRLRNATDSALAKLGGIQISNFAPIRRRSPSPTRCQPAPQMTENRVSESPGKKKVGRATPLQRDSATRKSSNSIRKALKSIDSTFSSTFYQ